MKNITKEKLINLYINKNLSMVEIGKIFRCDRKNISYHLKKHGIKKEKSEIFKCKEVDEEYIKVNITNGKTCSEIAKELKIGRNKVSEISKKLGIYDVVLKNRSDKQKKMMSENNPVPIGSKRPEISKIISEIRFKKRQEELEYLSENTFEKYDTFKKYSKKARALAYHY